jgi:hypothetical protein
LTAGAWPRHECGTVNGTPRIRVLGSSHEVQSAQPASGASRSDRWLDRVLVGRLGQGKGLLFSNGQISNRQRSFFSAGRRHLRRRQTSPQKETRSHRIAKRPIPRGTTLLIRYRKSSIEIVARNGTKWHGSEKSSIPHRDLRRRYVVESMDKKPVVLFPKLSDVSKNLPNRPSFMISIGQQRYEVRVLTEITPARLRVAEVISIDRGTRATE